MPESPAPWSQLRFELYALLDKLEEETSKEVYEQHLDQALTNVRALLRISDEEIKALGGTRIRNILEGREKYG